MQVVRPGRSDRRGNVQGGLGEACSGGTPAARARVNRHHVQQSVLPRRVSTATGRGRGLSARRSVPWGRRTRVPTCRGSLPAASRWCARVSAWGRGVPTARGLRSVPAACRCASVSAYWPGCARSRRRSACSVRPTASAAASPCSTEAQPSCAAGGRRAWPPRCRAWPPRRCAAGAGRSTLWKGSGCARTRLRDTNCRRGCKLPAIDLPAGCKGAHCGVSMRSS